MACREQVLGGLKGLYRFRKLGPPKPSNRLRNATCVFSGKGDREEWLPSANPSVSLSLGFREFRSFVYLSAHSSS